MTLDPATLEWALIHVKRFYSSDFFPEPFEFEAIQSQWGQVRNYLSSINLETYAPQTPRQLLAPKPNGTFRVVHQLDPLDSLLYTALVYSFATDLEQIRIPAKEGIACSYRIAPDVNGSFFSPNADGWELFNSRTDSLLKSYADGVVLIIDIVDYYNQIYSHRVRNAVGEISSPNAELLGTIVEGFIQCLSTQTSRGIPVGPAASIILAEGVMVDLDRKVLSYTRDFVRWVDDYRIFFPSESDALLFLHDFTQYIHDNHRLVLSGEKTKILESKQFRSFHKANDQEREKALLEERTQALVLAEHYEELFVDAGPYGEDEFDEDRYAELISSFQKDRKFKIASSAYKGLLEKEVRSGQIDFLLLRRILRNSRHYKIKSILPTLIRNFHLFNPIVREVCIYLGSVMSPKDVQRFKSELNDLTLDEHSLLPYVNMWIAWLLSRPAFKEVANDCDVKRFLSICDQALLALSRGDRTWVRTHKNGLDTLGPYEKRAVLHSSQVLTSDEQKVWLRIAKSRGSLLDQVVADWLLSK